MDLRRERWKGKPCSVLAETLVRMGSEATRYQRPPGASEVPKYFNAQAPRACPNHGRGKYLIGE